jgi:DNA-binding transcriptional LysR family regulator
LFDRRMKSAALTPAGDAFLPKAIGLLRMADEATAAIRQFSQRRAVLRIGGDEPGAHALLPALSIFLARQPDVSIEFRRVADPDVPAEVGAGTIDIGVTTRERVPAPLSSVRVPILAAGFCVLLPKTHSFASWRELPMTILHADRLVMLAGAPMPGPPAGVFVVMPGIDSLKQAVATGLGIGIVPRAAVSSVTAAAGLVAIPLAAARAAGALTLVYRDNDGQPNAVEGFIEALRSTGDDRASRKALIPIRASR